MARKDYNKAELLERIIFENLPADQFYREESDKKQIYLHFTVSGYGVKGDINWFLTDPKKVATHFLVQYDGAIYQLFNTKYWCHHLGIRKEFFREKLGDDKLIISPKNNILNNHLLNKHSIGIEIDTWGPLIEFQGNFYPIKWDLIKKCNVANLSAAPVSKSNVLTLNKPYRGFVYYERFSEAQIRSVETLLYYLGDKFHIPLTYQENMFEVSLKALEGEPGVWSHSSVRPDKYDIMPQPEMIEMLKSLTK